jgi:phage protein D/phage baseplate assembly protein gpV
MSVTTLPGVLVEAGGGALPGPALAALEHVRVHQRLDAPALCELSFHVGPGFDASVLPDPGGDLRVSLAPDGTELFSGDVTAAEHVFAPDGGHTVLVRGYDQLHRLRRSQHVTAQAQATLGELADHLAGAIGLGVEAPDSELSWERHLQLGETDLEVLVLLCERAGAYAVVQDGTLRFLTPEGDGESVTLTLGRELLEARVVRNADRAAGSVTATGWNPLTAEAHTGSASSPQLGADSAALPDGGAFGQSGEVLLSDELVVGDDHAAALAQAELDRRAAHAATLWGVADGDARLRPGARIEVAGLGSAAGDGAHVVASAQHTIDERRGYVTELSTALPAPHPRSRGAVATLGEVTSVDDPDQLGRVKVKLPAYGDVETDWLGVVVPAAGSDKGLIALPDVQDTVLVLLPGGGGAGAGMVIGGLYGQTAPPDPGVDSGAVKRYTLRTAGGQIVTLDDTASKLRLEDTTGNYLEMTPEKVLLHAAVDLTVEAPGRAVTLSGNTVDFTQV